MAGARRGGAPAVITARSLALTLLIMLPLALAIAVIVLSRRAPEPLPAAAIIRVLEAPRSPSEIERVDAVSEDETRIIIAAEAKADLRMDGPALPAPVITLTPLPLRIGAAVNAAGLDGQELNVRSRPSLRDSVILFRVREGDAFELVAGPQLADGLIWWRVRDQRLGVEGWAAADYLRLAAP